MKQVWLRFYDPLNDVESLLRSSRKYQNVKMQRGLRIALDPVFEKFTWRRVMLYDDMNMSTVDIMKLLTQFALTVEELEMKRIGLKLKTQLAPMDFPLLRKLEFKQSVDKLLSIFMGKNPRLLYVYFDPIATEEESLLDKVYKNNPQIRHLMLPISTDKLSQFDVNRFKHLTLQKLMFSYNYHYSSRSDETLKNYSKFLENHQELEVIAINQQSFDLDCSLLAATLGTARNLKFLSLQGLQPTLEGITRLSISHTVIELNFGFSKKLETELLIKFPNLIVLSVGNVDKRLLLFIASNLMSLKLLRFLVITEEAVDFYEDLKNSESAANKKIQLMRQTIKEHLSQSHVKTVEYYGE